MTADLIKRLEEATGPSRELDALIHTAVTGQEVIYEGGERQHSAVIVGAKTWVERDGRECAAIDGFVPRYTASLDDALTLVPEGWRIVHMRHDDSRDPWDVLAVSGAIEAKAASGRHSDLRSALCIASLKARGA